MTPLQRPKQWEDKAVLTERISRGSADYEFTVSDPTTWAAPWTAMIPLKAKNELIYEYACHEGNDAIPDMLCGHASRSAKPRARGN